MAGSGTSTAAAERRDAFLLFNSAEKVIELIDERLRKQGITTWYTPHDIAPGQDWAPIEEAAMDAAGVVVCFLGTAGWGPAHREYMKKALDQKRTVIPVYLGDANENALTQFDSFFRTKVRIDLRNPTDEKALASLVKAIRAAAPRLRPQLDADEVLEALLSENPDRRYEILEQLKAASKTHDHSVLRSRLIKAIDETDSGERREWLVTALAWVAQADPEAIAKLGAYLDPKVEPDSGARWRVLAGSYDSGANLPTDLLLRARSSTA
jgi:hypothetical protein